MFFTFRMSLGKLTTILFFLFICFGYTSAISFLHNDNTVPAPYAVSEENYRSNPKRIYEIKDFVMCLDEIFLKKRHSVHFAFLGDSLICYQFLNLISVSTYKIFVNK